MSLPIVSIIIPYSIDRGWLDKAIASVYNQTYTGKIELIESQSEGNVSHNINEGFKISKGSLIKYLCEDDELTPNCISDSVQAIERFDFIHGNALNVYHNRTEQQRPRKANPTLEDMLHMNLIHGGTLMFKRSVFNSIGMFDETLTCAEEYDFNLRALKFGLKLGYCNTFLYKYRRHDKQKSLGGGVDQIARALKIDEIKNKYR